MAATVPSPESRGRIERLSAVLLDTISRFIQAEGATPPEVQTAAGHMFIVKEFAFCAWPEVPVAQG